MNDNERAAIKKQIREWYRVKGKLNGTITISAAGGNLSPIHSKFAWMIRTARSNYCRKKKAVILCTSNILITIMSISNTSPFQK